MYAWHAIPTAHVVVGIEYKAVVTYKTKPVALCVSESHARRIAAFLNAAADIDVDAGIQASVGVSVQ